jgi:phage shock protein A
MFMRSEAIMLKTLTLILRGTSAQAAEDLADKNALLILDQHVRDAGAGLDRARRALAIAMAQDAAEVKRLEGVQAKIEDLEIRARAALNGGREDLALEAAQALADLEADRTSGEAAHASFLRESHKLRAMVANAERRLAELERGRRAARASEAVRRLRASGTTTGVGDAGSLRDAEAVLKRLRDRQLEDEAADDALMIKELMSSRRFRAVVLGAVLFRVERQRSQERARHHDPLWRCVRPRRLAGDGRGRGVHLSLLRAFGARRRTRRQICQIGRRPPAEIRRDLRRLLRGRSAFSCIPCRCCS